MLDPRALVRGQRLRMREVEAQLVGPHGRAGLLDVLAQQVAERLVQHVRRRVVGHGREAHRPRHDRTHADAFAEPLAAEGQHLVVV